MFSLALLEVEGEEEEVLGEGVGGQSAMSTVPLPVVRRRVVGGEEWGKWGKMSWLV